MKKLTKGIAIVMVLCMALMLVSCALAPGLTGKYVLTAFSYNGQDLTPEEIESLGEWSLEFTSNKNVKITFVTESSATYNLEGNNISITDLSGTLEGIVEGNTIILSQTDGGVVGVMTFEKI